MKAQFCVFLFFIPTVTAALFDVCTSNGQCNGKNQLCEKFAYAKPGCSTGMCQCKPCYVLDVDGCQKVKYINNLDEPCTLGRKSEIISVPRAACNNSKVGCFMAERRNGRCYAFRKCNTVTRGCSPGMICQEGNCVCPKKWQRFEHRKQECVDRKYGDPCVADEECQIKSSYNPSWSNFGVCTNKRCACNEDTIPAQWSGIDADTNTFITMTTCFKPTVSTDIESGICYKNPISDNNDDTARICAVGYTCVICPDGGNEYGDCRKIVESQVISSDQCGRRVPTTSSAVSLSVLSSTRGGFLFLLFFALSSSLVSSSSVSSSLCH